MTESSSAQRRPPRQRARLSESAIIEQGLALLEEGSIAEFSLARLAQRLGASVMSLYTYFPSRDALLLALAEDIFRRFEAPAPAARWQDEVRDWLWATVRHLDRYPVALKLSVWDGHISPGWLQTWFPLASLIKAQGLSGPDLAFAMNWFTTAAMGFITAQMSSPTTRQDRALAHIGVLDGPHQRFAAELWFDFKLLERDPSLAFGFDHIIQGLEAIIAMRRSDGRQ